MQIVIIAVILAGFYILLTIIEAVKRGNEIHKTRTALRELADQARRESRGDL